MEAKSMNAGAMKVLKLNAFVAVLTCAVGTISLFSPEQVKSQERLKIIYSQFTMTNSATWFAREAGLFERHGLTADLIYVDSTPAVQALTAGQRPWLRCPARLAVGPYFEQPGFGHALAGWSDSNSYRTHHWFPKNRHPEDLRGKIIGIGRFGATADSGPALDSPETWDGMKQKTCRSFRPAAAVRRPALPRWRLKRSTPLCSTLHRPSRPGA